MKVWILACWCSLAADIHVQEQGKSDDTFLLSIPSRETRDVWVSKAASPVLYKVVLSYWCPRSASKSFVVLWVFPGKWCFQNVPAVLAKQMTAREVSAPVDW